MAEIVKTISIGKKNLAMNGDMQINQKGLTIVGTSSFQYVLDRFAGQFSDVASVTAPTMVLSSLPASFPGNSNQLGGRAFRMHGTVNSLAPSPTYNMMQRIESIYLKSETRKQISTVSAGIWVYGNNFSDISIEAYQATGVANDDDWSSSTLLKQVTIPINENEWTYVSLKDITLSTIKGIEIRVNFIGALATVFADTYMTELMVNEGVNVENFRLFGDGTFQSEMAFCKRYYEKSQVYEVNINAGLPPTWTSGQGKHILEHATVAPVGTERWIGDVAFEVEKRSIPTIIIKDGAGTINNISLLNLSGGTTLNSQSFNTTAASKDGFSLRTNAASTYGLASRAGFMCSWIADSEL